MLCTSGACCRTRSRHAPSILQVGLQAAEHAGLLHGGQSDPGDKGAHPGRDEEGDDDSICMGDLWGPVGRMPYSVQVLSRIVQLHTGVFVVKEHLDGGTRLRAYGRRDEVEVALYLMDVLHNALEKELARRRALTPDLYYGVGGTNSFYAGVLAAMKERMEKHDGDRSEEKALTLAQADNEERARRIVFQDCRITRRSGKGRLNRAAYAGGQDYGSSLTIAKGIGKDSHGPLMLS